MKKTQISTIVLLATFPFLAAGSSIPSIHVPDKVIQNAAGRTMNDFLTRLASFGFHGSVLAAQDGEILLHNAYGLADVERSVSNHTSTLFSTGSVTKQFTAAGIMLLEMEGKLSTTDSIGKFFADVPPDKQGITIHYLLTHTAGLPGHSGADEDAISRDDFLKQTLNEPLLFPVGDRYEYSNVGFSYLAAIIELVSGMEYERFLQERLFEPAGMSSTGLHLVDVPDTLVAHSHAAEVDYLSPADRPREDWHLRGSGGLLSTPADMYRWHRALLTDELVSDRAKVKMFTPHVREYEDQKSYYGFGWVVQESSRGTTLYWHNGGAMPHGWSCAFYRYVDDNAVFIVFSNKPLDGMLPVDHIVANLAGILFGVDYQMPPEVSSSAATDLTSYKGRYLLPDSTIFEVTVQDGKLYLIPEGQAAFMALFPSPMARMLPKYNDKTKALILAVADGNIDQALEYFDPGMAPAEKWREMTNHFWQSLVDSLGAFENVEILGTIGSGGAKTHCRIHFAAGSTVCRFFWMKDKCGGIMSDVELPKKELLSQSETEFAGFSLAEGTALKAEFTSEGEMLLTLGSETIRAIRM